MTVEKKESASTTRRLVNAVSNAVLRHGIIWIIVIVALSFALKLFTLDKSVSLSADYGSYLRLTDVIRGLDVRGAGLRYPPIFPAVLLVFSMLFNEVEALKVCAAFLFSIVAVPFYFLAKKVTRIPALPVVASLLSVFNMFYAEMIGWGGNANILAISFMMTYFIFWLDSVEDDRVGKNAFLSAFFLSLSIGTHFLVTVYLIIFCLPLLFLLVTCRKKMKIKTIIKRSLIILTVGLAFSMPYIFAYVGLLESMVMHETSYSVADQRSMLNALYFLNKSIINIVPMFLGVAGILIYFKIRNRILGLTMLSLFIAGCLPLFTQNAVRWTYFWPVPLFLGIIASIEFILSKKYRMPNHFLRIVSLVLVSIVICTYMTYSVIYMQETCTYYNALSNESLAAIEWIKASTDKNSIIATSGPYKRGSDGGGLVYGWWIEGHGERKSIATSYLRFLTYKDERRLAENANIIFSGTDVIKNEYVMAAETFNAKLGNPEIGVNIGDYFEKILSLNDNEIMINYRKPSSTANTTLYQMNCKSRSILQSEHENGIRTFYSNEHLNISKLVTVHRNSPVVDISFEIQQEVATANIMIPLLKSDFVDVSSLDRVDSETILQVVTPMRAQAQISISAQFNGTLETRARVFSPESSTEERNIVTFIFEPLEEDAFHLRITFPMLVDSSNGPVEYNDSYELIKSMNITYFMINKHRTREFEWLSSDKNHFSSAFANQEIAIFKVEYRLQT